jgi:hypothetical protein
LPAKKHPPLWSSRLHQGENVARVR